MSGSGAGLRRADENFRALEAEKERLIDENPLSQARANVRNEVEVDVQEAEMPCIAHLSLFSAAHKDHGKPFIP